MGLRLHLLFLFVSLAACPWPPCQSNTNFSLDPGEETGPLMRPGNNCLRCHSATGVAANRPFSFGGTLFPTSTADLCSGVAGVTVRVTDANQKTVTAVSNEVGNFFSAEPLTPPLTMEAERNGVIARMPGNAPTGGCALCHSWPAPSSGAAGRIRAPSGG